MNAATSEFNYKRLDLARRRRGMTKRALAESAGITTKSLRNIELLKHEPRKPTVSHLARTLFFPEGFFYGSDPEYPPENGVSFRSISTLTTRFRDQVLAAGTLGLSLSDWIEDRFNLPAVSIPEVQTKDPELAASETRRSWGLGQRPIKNLIHLLELHGVRVFSLAEDTIKVDAYSFWRNDTPYMFLNTQKSAERSRMDAAHELGHLILHTDGGPQRDRKAEKEAQQFGSALLMPKDSVISETRRGASLQEIRRMKKFWNVSVANLTYRMYEVGMLSEYQYRMRFMEISQRGFHVAEPDPLARETSQLLEKVFLALRERDMSVADVAEDLSIRPEELSKLLLGLLNTPLPIEAAR